MKNRDLETFLKNQKDLSRRYLLGGIVSHYLSGALIVLQLWVLANIVHDIAFLDKSLDDELIFLAAFSALVAGRFLLSAAGNYWATIASINIKQALRNRLYKTVEQSGPVTITEQGSGSLINSLVDGVEATGAYYQDYLPAKALMAAIPMTLLVFVLPVDWMSGLIMVVTAPMIPVFMIIIGKGAERRNQTQWRNLARMGNHFLDVVQGLTTLKMYGASKREAKTIAKIADQYRQDTMSVLRIAFLSSVTLEFFATVSVAVIAVIIGFRLLWGEMDFLNGFFILLLAPEFYLPLRKMGAAYHARMEAIGAVEKIAEILGENGHAADMQSGSRKVSDDAAVSIRFDGVHCVYAGPKKAINGITLDIKPNQKLALVGASGSGKSTIFNLLLGFVQPSEGSISVNGTPLCDLDMNEWRKSIAWIPQTPTLFDGTVIDNIRMGRQDATDEEIFRLCEGLGIDTFIRKLPQGYDTRVGERGAGLSGGQIQRIAIARAFLRDSSFILMDEPTASLDMKTEAVLQKAMDHLTQGKTVVTIAHRLHTIKNADQIVFLKNGLIESAGTHKALLKSNQSYANLVEQEFIATHDGKAGA